MYLKLSVPSYFRLRIYGLPLATRVADPHVLVDAALGGFEIGGPRRDHGAQRVDVANAAILQALPRPARHGSALAGSNTS